MKAPRCIWTAFAIFFACLVTPCTARADIDIKVDGSGYKYPIDRIAETLRALVLRQAPPSKDPVLSGMVPCLDVDRAVDGYLAIRNWVESEEFYYKNLVPYGARYVAWGELLDLRKRNKCNVAYVVPVRTRTLIRPYAKVSFPGHEGAGEIVLREDRARIEVRIDHNLKVAKPRFYGPGASARLVDSGRRNADRYEIWTVAVALDPGTRDTLGVEVHDDRGNFIDGNKIGLFRKPEPPQIETTLDVDGPGYPPRIETAADRARLEVQVIGDSRIAMIAIEVRDGGRLVPGSKRTISDLEMLDDTINYRGTLDVPMPPVGQVWTVAIRLLDGDRRAVENTRGRPVEHVIELYRLPPPDKVPPVITVVEPEPVQGTESAVVRIEVSVTDDTAVDWVTLDGRKMAFVDGDRYEADAILPAGRNSLSLKVEAADKAGTRAAATVRVLREALKVEIDAPSRLRSLQAKASLHVVVRGDGRVRSLGFAGADSPDAIDLGARPGPVLFDGNVTVAMPRPGRSSALTLRAYDDSGAVVAELTVTRIRIEDKPGFWDWVLYIGGGAVGLAVLAGIYRLIFPSTPRPPRGRKARVKAMNIPSYRANPAPVPRLEVDSPGPRIATRIDWAPPVLQIRKNGGYEP